MSAQTTQLSATTKLLHWLVGLGMIFLIALGIYMSETETYALYDLHKSLGALMIVFVIARIAWRIKKGWLSRINNGEQVTNL